jgi:hypothetical protein
MKISRPIIYTMSLEFLKGKINATLIVVVVLLVYAGISWNASRIYADILTGFWKCPPEFLEEAGLTSFLLYLGPPNWRGVRACYILAGRGPEMIINEPASVSLTQTWRAANWAMGFSKRTYLAQFYDLETEDFPATQTLVLHPRSGKLIMSSNETIYAVLYKDNISSEAALRTTEPADTTEDLSSENEGGEDERGESGEPKKDIETLG